MQYISSGIERVRTNFSSKEEVFSISVENFYGKFESAH